MPVVINPSTPGTNDHQFADDINTLRPRQNGRHFADDIFKCIFLNGNVRISIKCSLKFVPKDPINSIPALVQIMAWRRPGDKPLSEPMMVSLLTHICVTRPQWVKSMVSCQKGPICRVGPFQQDTIDFWMHFREWKVLYFEKNHTEVCFYGSNWQ